MSGTLGKCDKVLGLAFASMLAQSDKDKLNVKNYMAEADEMLNKK